MTYTETLTMNQLHLCYLLNILLVRITKERKPLYVLTCLFLNLSPILNVIDIERISKITKCDFKTKHTQILEAVMNQHILYLFSVCNVILVTRMYFYF